MFGSVIVLNQRHLRRVLSIYSRTVEVGRGGLILLQIVPHLISQTSRTGNVEFVSTPDRGG
jgi:hypothetical protein